jgi:hypothetical protein
VTGWTDLRIGDPADDIAWLVGSNEPKFIDAVLAAYHEARKEPVDPQLARRAALAAEFALAQYLVKALALGDQEVARDAEAMLAELAADIEASEAAEAEAAGTSRDGVAGAGTEAPASEGGQPAAERPRTADPAPATDAIPLITDGRDG